MIDPAHVLLIGNDPVSRHEQMDVLQHFWTISAAGSDCYQQYLPTSHIAVLCHSLTDMERDLAVATINREQTQLLLIKMNGYDSGPHAGMDASIDLRHGPGSLVSTIYQLLTERGMPSRGWPSLPFEFGPGLH